MAEIDNKDEVAQIHDDLWESATGKPPRITKYKATQQVLRLIKQQTIKAQIARLTDIFTAIDGETASNEYVFKLANSIEDRISTLEAELKEIEGGQPS